MFANIDRHVKLLCDLKITANQYILCFLLCTDKKINGKYVSTRANAANLYRYGVLVKPWTEAEIDDLEEKGYIVNRNKKGSYECDLYDVTDKFKQAVFKSMNSFEELWNAYPKTVASFDGSKQRIKLKVCDPDAMEELYNKKVKTKILHNKIIHLVEWATENNQLNLGFEKFIISNGWETLEEIYNEYNQSDNTYIPR